MKKPPKGIGLYIRTLRSGELKYESRLWNPYLKRIGKKKIWQEKDLNKVIELHQVFKQKYVTNNYDLKSDLSQVKSLPQMLLECAALYERYLNDDPELVPAHKAKHRSSKHIKDTINYIRAFFICLKDSGYNLSHTHISAVNDEAVSIFYEYLERRFEDKEIGSVTWNKHIIRCRTWINTLIDYFGYELKNPFEDVTPKSEVKDPQFLDIHELYDLISAVIPKNGWGTRGTQAHRFNYYREWLPSYFLISAFIGGRPGEITSLKWCHISEDYIKIQNKKVGRQKINYVYIHPELAKVLAPMRAKSQSEYEYVLVPEWQNRSSLYSFVSKAFNHFLKKTNIDKKVSLYNLRHTYVNVLYNVIGEAGLSVHHKKETAIKHYLAKKQKLELQEGKTLFQDVFNDFI